MKEIRLQKDLVIPIIIRNDEGHIEDLGDLLKVAQAKGKVILKVEKVKVLPVVYQFEDSYIVLVQPYDSRCKASIVGGAKAKNK